MILNSFDHRFGGVWSYAKPLLADSLIKAQAGVAFDQNNPTFPPLPYRTKRTVFYSKDFKQRSLFAVWTGKAGYGLSVWRGRYNPKNSLPSLIGFAVRSRLIAITNVIRLRGMSDKLLSSHCRVG